MSGPTGGSTTDHDVRIVVQPVPCLFRQVVARGQDAPERCVRAVQVGHPLVEGRVPQPVRFGEVPTQGHLGLDASVRALGFHERVQSGPGFGIRMATARGRDPHVRVVDVQQQGNHLPKR
ncbi:hypothetical protein B6E66_01590 [Streptomyces maremycinicus]|nr:hypothetical protein B6E66_01590 [Streptomyces sp. B9173]